MMMQIETAIGASAHDGMHWGDHQGRPVLMLQQGGARVTVLFATAAEARALGCGGIYLAQVCELQALKPGEGVRPSPIVGVDGAPMANGGRRGAD